jgi:hypothetical protein
MVSTAWISDPKLKFPAIFIFCGIMPGREAELLIRLTGQRNVLNKSVIFLKLLIGMDF